MRTTLGVLVLMCAGAAQAATTQVPCEEYVRVMNARVACEAMPMVPVESARWQKRLYERCLSEHNFVPWKGDVPAACQALQPERAEVATATRGQPSPEAACKLPPWKHPKGLVCK